MQKKVGAQNYIELDVISQFHLKDVFELAVQCVLHPVYHKEEKSTKKKTKFHLFKNKYKKSSKKDKDIESNGKKQENMHLKISSSTTYELDNKKQENNLLKISSSTAYKFENKEEKKNLEVSLLNSEDFIKEGENKNMFIDENDEKHHIFIEKISQNEFTILNKIVDTLTNRVMCKKILIPEDQLFEHMKNAIKEFDVLKQINHPCICKIFGINTAETVVNNEDNEITTIALFLEYLEYYLNSLITKGTLTNTIKVRIIIEIIHAMIYIHKHNMIYSDLKVDNVRLDSNLNAKIVDVGLIKINESLYQGSSCSQSSFIKNIESAIFMSPEILKDEE